MIKQKPTVHLAAVIDASGSMRRLESKVEEIVDQWIRDMKKQSEELDLETRVSVYRFSYNTDIQCLVYDMDVFRLPSIKDLFKTGGQTALVDAVIKSQKDLALPYPHGDHHFRTYVWTDGGENDSVNRPLALASLLATQGPNWSIAAYVPGQREKDMAVLSGFPAGNVQIWNTTAAGLEETYSSVTTSSSVYMSNISKGIVNDKNNVFGTGTDKVNANTVKANLVPLTKGSYQVWDVDADTRIDLFVQSKGWTFHVGKGYYQLTDKSVLVQANKRILVLEKSTGLVYGGAEARALVGLPPNTDARVKADANPDYIVLSQSTANNRKLLAGTKFVYTS